MFRLLSVHPGSDFDVSVAAAIAGVTVVQARRLLERLVADHLVGSASPGRYQLHDLLRAYAAELCDDDEAAALRMTEWCVHTLEHAVTHENRRVVLPVGALVSAVVPQEFSSRFDAVAWVRQEWDNLRDVCHAAIGRGWKGLALRVPMYLGPYRGSTLRGWVRRLRCSTR
jgi:hypothetical protein